MASGFREAGRPESDRVRPVFDIAVSQRLSEKQTYPKQEAEEKREHRDEAGRKEAALSESTR